MQVVDPSEASKSREDSLAKTLSRKLGIADVPEHVAFDGKVLRYECFFKEAVVESNEENYRVRRCVLFFYLLDGSVQVRAPLRSCPAARRASTGRAPFSRRRASARGALLLPPRSGP